MLVKAPVTSIENAPMPVFNAPHVHCTVPARRHHTAISGDCVGQPALDRELAEDGLRIERIIAQLASGRAETRDAGAQQLRHRCKRHRELLAAAIGFGHGHHQIATVASRVQIGDFKRTRGDIRFLQHLAVLANRHAGVRFRGAVFSNSGLSLERPGIGNAKRVDPLLIGRVYPGG
jgi:hypothetical protein